MSHGQKPDFVFRRNGRVHLNRRGRKFNRLLAAEMCASAVVMLDTPCSELVWRVLATHFIRQFPLHFPSRASPCAIMFQLDSTSICPYHLHVPTVWKYGSLSLLEPSRPSQACAMISLPFTCTQLSLENELLVYKAILKHVWTYGIQLWGTASNSNIEILERFQAKALRIITKAPWFVSQRCDPTRLTTPKALRIITNAPWSVPNAVIQRDLRLPKHYVS